MCVCPSICDLIWSLDALMNCYAVACVYTLGIYSPILGHCESCWRVVCVCVCVLRCNSFWSFQSAWSYCVEVCKYCFFCFSLYPGHCQSRWCCRCEWMNACLCVGAFQGAARTPAAVPPRQWRRSHPLAGQRHGPGCPPDHHRGTVAVRAVPSCGTEHWCPVLSPVLHRTSPVNTNTEVTTWTSKTQQ